MMVYKIKLPTGETRNGSNLNKCVPLMVHKRILYNSLPRSIRCTQYKELLEIIIFNSVVLLQLLLLDGH